MQSALVNLLGRWPRSWRREAPGLLILAVALAFNFCFLQSELRIGQHPPNDGVLHRAAAERLGQSLANGEPFLDPWVSEWSLGYPVWSSYQPLAHLLTAGWLALAKPWHDAPAAFAALVYLLIAFFPASVYLGARLLGLTPVAAGLSSVLVLAPSASGEYGRYGLSYGASTWRGSGLLTQVVALHLLLVALGITARAIDTGRRRALAALALATVSLAHIVFGYVAFAAAAVLGLTACAGQRARELVRLATIVLPALLLLAWFVVPLFLMHHEVNHSRYESPFKWDSAGAPAVLDELISGRLFDAGRWPVLTSLIGVGALVALRARRERAALRLLVLTGVFLALYFGRATWGHLLLLVGVPSDLHMHRLQAPFELFAVMLAGFGIARLLERLATGLLRWQGSRCWRWAALAAGAVLLVVGLVALGRERAEFLAQNTALGEESLRSSASTASALEQALAAVRAITAKTPGRVSAGKAATWGNEFKVGEVPVYAELTAAHLDQVSFLYHSMSLTSDLMVLRDEADPAHDALFGVRAVVAPAGMAVPPHLQLRATAGPFAVYEASAEGYFGLVDVGGRYLGPRASWFEPSALWLTSQSLRQGVVFALGGQTPATPVFGRWQPLPQVPAVLLEPRGHVLSEEKRGEEYRAAVEAARSCYTLVKITFHPDLLATVDGQPVPTVRVTPGFVAVPVTAGRHEVVVRYQPGPLRPLLLATGIALFILLVVLRRRAPVARHEEALASRLGGGVEAFFSARRRSAVVLLLLALIAFRPLVRGMLVDGHDATEYPPRLSELERVLGDGHVPPVWAPDLGAGHGQPLFGFAPPLVYMVALPFRGLGLGLADSLQLGLLLLFLLGAAAVYRIGRSLGFDRSVSSAGSVAWLFAPYTALDLFVRAAYAEAAAIAVAPIALFLVWRAVVKPSWQRAALAAIGVAFVMLGHNGMALLFLPALAVLVVARAWPADDRWTRLFSGGGAIAAGLGLAAFFWLPALAESELVKVDLLRTDFLRWELHAISPLQLVWGRWGYGYSGPGTDDGMSYALGAAHLTLAILGVSLALRRGDRRSRLVFATCGFIALGGALLATTWAAWVWQRLPILQFLAFPWRALALPGLLLPLLALPAFAWLRGRWRLAAVGLLVILNLPHTEPKSYLAFDDEFYEPASIARRGLNTSTREEYEPTAVVERPPWSAVRLAGAGDVAQIVELSFSTLRQEYEVRASEAVRLEASTFYYPGWRATVDGVPVAIAPVPGRGTIGLDIPAGRHRVALIFGRTPIRAIALWLSMATAILLGVAAAGARLARLGGRIRPEMRE
jgi:uncharacterized membrane protein